ncbi:hypothetical protein Tco_0956606 [Tanacetum coccineum]
MKETYHVTFSEDDEAISKSCIEGDEMNFNENRSFPNDEFLVPRSKVTQCSSKDDYFPYVPAYDPVSTTNITIPNHIIPTDSPTPQDINSLKESPDEVEPSPTLILPSAEVATNPLVPQDRGSREKHIDLVNIIGEPLAGVTIRSRIRDSEATSAHECLYVNFLFKIEPKRLIEALEEEG